MQRYVRMDYILNQISAVFLSIHLISTEENIAPDDWYVTGRAMKRRSATLRGIDYILNQIGAAFLSIHLISSSFVWLPKRPNQYPESTSHSL